jgi:hypothetical protein
MANVNPDSPENWGKDRSNNFTINGRPADAPRPYTPAPAPAPAQPQCPATRAEQAFSALEQLRQEYRASLDALHQSDLTDEGKAKARRELASAHAHTRTSRLAVATHDSKLTARRLVITFVPTTSRKLEV